ncbi:hypothetical protein QTN25_003453 [Entamoeba marina]
MSVDRPFKQTSFIRKKGQLPQSSYITKMLTSALVTTFNRCTPIDELILTNPPHPISAYSKDNELNDLIVRKGDIIGNLTSLEGCQFSTNEVEEVKEIRATLHDFLVRCLSYDPKDRLTPDQALVHPFIVGASLEGYNQPPREIPYKEYGKVMSLEGEEYVQEVFDGKIASVTENQTYYQIFMKALKSGHVVNVLMESPFQIYSKKDPLPRKFKCNHFPKDEDEEDTLSPSISPSPNLRNSPITPNEKDPSKSTKKPWTKIKNWLSPLHSPKISPKTSPKISPKTSPKISPKISPKLKHVHTYSKTKNFAASAEATFQEVIPDEPVNKRRHSLRLSEEKPNKQKKRWLSRSSSSEQDLKNDKKKDKKERNKNMVRNGRLLPLQEPSKCTIFLFIYQSQKIDKFFSIRNSQIRIKINALFFFVLFVLYFYSSSLVVQPDLIILYYSVYIHSAFICSIPLCCLLITSYYTVSL